MAEERQENLGFTEPGALPGETHIVRRRSPRRVLKGFLFLVVSGALLAVAVYSPLFSVRDVRIIGNHYMPADDIRRVAGVYPGVPLFQVKTAEMTQLLMKDLRVEQASARRLRYRSSSAAPSPPSTATLATSISTAKARSSTPTRR